MNRVQVLREYNDFLKERFNEGEAELNASLIAYLEKTCVEVPEGEVSKFDTYEDMPIDRLDLPLRPRNVLLRSGITTVGQLLPMSQSELMRIRNMGRKSLDEINEKVRQIKEQKNDTI